ncbi:hypothetical protein E4J89_13625 [Arthrobacter sp. CAU 1506]|uniref:hypothetical protein n=1 Tax=Arthrobacter sp. CAU 1506 TaxID=2560052 RepID=UPI0010AD570A|nr:hypothetical protein [Arthrobacter sp. CAU 1506]TJY68907.1 hypothetical protein E4J89_13625 [Arthrobacter sp. CAU 1506]
MTAVAQWGSTAQHDAGARLVRLARLCAVVAFTSIAAHLWMAWQHLDTPWQSLLMLAMAAFCLPCALKSWRRGGAGPARMLMLAALAMAAFHTWLLTGAGSYGGGHAGHGVAAAGSTALGAGPVGTAVGAESLTAVLPHTEMMLGVILLELLAAVSAAFYLNRLRQRP